MDLTHICHKPITTLVPTPLSKQHTFFKPKGLWFSDNDSEENWALWCQDNEFDGNWKHEYKLTFSAAAKLLYIVNKKQLEYFHEKYSTRRYEMNWQLIAAKYDGIIITPYQWDYRWVYLWYSAWDIASACIWNTDIITLTEVNT